MNILDIIANKKQKQELTKEEIYFAVEGFCSGKIPDYQMSALLMAICINSMTDNETMYLTEAMMQSGESLDLAQLGDTTADKHSTGGIGDKVTLIAAPVAAACGVMVPKMSGKGLGFTGGTIDKLESIPGFSTDIPIDRFFEIVKSCGMAVIAQSPRMAPADGQLYALRDVTATVDSIPLICSSIMSKKLVVGAKSIVLDVKYGTGAFMKEKSEAVKLANLMKAIADKAGRKCTAVLSDMNSPLGYTIGNSLEVIEAIEVLKGNKKGALYKKSVEIASNMISLARDIALPEATILAKAAVSSGRALAVFARMIELQGGNSRVIEDYSLFPQGGFCYEYLAPESGKIKFTNCAKAGEAARALGAGRLTKSDKIDYAAGILLHIKDGDIVNKNDVIAQFFYNKQCNLHDVSQLFSESMSIMHKE